MRSNNRNNHSELHHDYVNTSELVSQTSRNRFPLCQIEYDITSHSDRQTDRQTDSATGLTGTAGGVGVVKPRQTATFTAARCHYTRRVDRTVAIVVRAAVHLCTHHPSADQSTRPASKTRFFIYSFCSRARFTKYLTIYRTIIVSLSQDRLTIVS